MGGGRGFVSEVTQDRGDRGEGKGGTHTHTQKRTRNVGPYPFATYPLKRALTTKVADRELDLQGMNDIRRYRFHCVSREEESVRIVGEYRSGLPSS